LPSAAIIAVEVAHVELAFEVRVGLAAFAAFGYWCRERGERRRFGLCWRLRRRPWRSLSGESSPPRGPATPCEAPRSGFELAVFGLAIVALLAAGAPAAAVVLAVLVAMSTALLFRFDRWEA